MRSAPFVGSALSGFAHGVWRRMVDPLGPTDVDADDIRDQACSVTAPTRICDPRAPGDVDPPDLPDPGWPNLFADLLLLVVVVALAAGLVWLLSRLVLGARRAPSEDPDDVEDDLDESTDGVLGARVVDHDTPPREWRRLAADHVNRGEFRDAVRCRYRALVGDLARVGYVDEIAGRTSGEERSQVASTVVRLVGVAAGRDGPLRSEQVTSSFDRAAESFDVAWFDDGPVDADDLARYVAAERVVLDAVAAGRSIGRIRTGSVG